MPTQQFQSKLSDPDVSVSLKRNDSGDETNSPRVDWRPLSMLLHLRVHGHLSDSHKKYLDSLAPEQGLSYLIFGDHYLHPEDTPLFPSELIQNSLIEAGSPVFSQRYTTEDSITAEAYRILSTGIDTIGNSSLTFGLFGRERIMGEINTELCLSEAVSGLRRAATAAGDIFRKTAEAVARRLPCCIIERSTGTILVANNAFADFLNADIDSLPGTLYGDLTTDHPRQFRQNRIEMTNVDIGPSKVAIVAIDPAEQSEDSNLSQYFYHKFRNKLSAITTSASYLKTMSHKLLGPDESALLDVVIDEAGHLDHELHRFRLISEFDRLATEPRSFRDELEEAIGSIADDLDFHWKLTADNQTSHVTATWPDKCLYHFLEAITLAHSRQPGTGQLQVTAEPDIAGLTLEFTTDLTSQAAKQIHHWTAYATQIGALMGLESLSIARRESKKITTQMTFTTNEQTSHAEIH